MNVDVVAVPALLSRDKIEGRSVVVFDVLRATTSITAALAADVTEIRVFGDIVSAAAAAGECAAPKLLCGETRCLPPSGFDLGNSPGAFNRGSHAGRTMFLSTTNGTRAIIAARGAKLMLTGALVNATAVAERLLEAGNDVTLLCAGTGGTLAIEDLLGAGAVFHALRKQTETIAVSDTARLADWLFQSHQGQLLAALRDSTGGRNVIAAGLEPDIAFCAAIDSIKLVGVVRDEPLRVAL